MHNKTNLIWALILAGAVGLSACGGGGGSGGTAGGSTKPAEKKSTDAGTNTGATADPAAAVSIVIGSGDKIGVTAKDIKYQYRYAVTVRDAKGLPVEGAEVSITAQPVHYFKGAWVYKDPADDTKGRRQQITAKCAAEDVNNNDSLDPGEDINKDGMITPEKGQIVTVIEGGKNKTNNQGIVYVLAEYNKSHATWFAYTLTATAKVTGTEGKASKTDIAGYLSGDQDSKTIPFSVSPYGVSSLCTNPK